MDARWRIELFGGLSATRGDHRVTRFRSQKTAALLAYLAATCCAGARQQRAHPRPVLVELLWPDHDVELARHNLSVALSALREVVLARCPDRIVLLPSRVGEGGTAAPRGHRRAKRGGRGEVPGQ
jgi:DNA-binding SARP family transcriptional activator